MTLSNAPTEHPGQPRAGQLWRVHRLARLLRAAALPTELTG